MDDLIKSYACPHCGELPWPELYKNNTTNYASYSVKFVCYKREYFDLLITASGLDVNQKVELGREYQGNNKISDRPKVTMIGNKTSIGKEDNIDTVWIERVINYDQYVEFCKQRDDLYDTFDIVKKQEKAS